MVSEAVETAQLLYVVHVTLLKQGVNETRGLHLRVLIALLPYRSWISNDVSLRQFHHLGEQFGCVRAKEFHSAHD